MVFVWWGGRNIDTNWYNRITNRTTFVFQRRVYYICKEGMDCWQYEGGRVYMFWGGFLNIKYPTTLMRMGLDESDEHIAMGSICLECCTCENLRDRWWKKECGVHTRNREQNKSKDEWDGSYIDIKTVKYLSRKKKVKEQFQRNTPKRYNNLC